MELFIWTVGAIVSAIIGLVVSFFFGDPLKHLFYSFFSKFSIQRTESIAGLWLASFNFPEGGQNQVYREVVRIEEHFGMVTGRIVPDARNHAAVQAAAKERPVRLRGQLKDNVYLTGIWLHPLRRAHYHGSFQLVVHPSGGRMTGQWIGFSERRNRILSGAWEWERIDPVERGADEIPRIQNDDPHPGQQGRHHIPPEGGTHGDASRRPDAAPPRT